MYQVIIVVHVLLGLGVIGLVLIQQGKGADAGAAFGSASSGTVFGAQGASSFLSSTTAVLAALFFSTSLGLAVLSGHTDEVVDLMDTPEVEVFEDVPLISGSATVLPSSTESVPVIDTQSITDSVKGLVNDSVQVIEEGASDVVGTVSDRVQTIKDDTQPVVDTLVVE